jgi:TolB protein
MNGERMIRYVWLVVSLCLTFAAEPAFAKVSLDVYGQSYKKVTIATPPFKSDNGTKVKTDMGDLLAKDLDMSGFFIVAPKSVMDRELTEEGVDKKEIRFENWRSLGIELICKGLLQTQSGGLTLEIYLYDSSDGALLFAKRYRTTTDEWRRLVHRLADDIIQAVTGERGIMSSRVLFVAGGRHGKDILISDLDGADQRKLTDYSKITLSPCLSPDGKYLAFTSYKEGRPNLFVIDLEKKREIYANTDEGIKVGSTWLDKRTLVYTHTAGKYSTIYAQNVETKEKSVLLRQEGILASPSLSIDGRKMVFVSDMYGTPQIFIRDIPSGETKRLTYAGTYNTAPSLSPKGDLIAYGCKADGALEICVMKADGSEPRVLTDGGVNDSPQFSPCGRYILYSSSNGKKAGIYLMLHNGDNRRALSFTAGEDSQPKFVP